ncbi:MAG TPA: ABC transporter substrate-binding protein [Clostridiales bacterium]|nr:ABC transporter substrate-binding protein [Clostridiales bacterium]
MKKILSYLLIFSMLLSLSACTNNGGNNTATENPTTLVVGVTEMSGNFSPLYYSSTYDGYVIDLVHEALLKRNYNGELVPSLAKDYTYSEDGKSITFTLREDAKYSDGTNVTANDIAFSYMILSDKSYTGRFSSMAQDLVGYSEYRSGSTDKLTGVEVVNDYTITFHFKDAYRTNLENCLMQAIPKHLYPNYKQGDTSSIEANVNNPIGSGPYMLKEFKGKEYASLTKNPNYSGTGYEIQNVIMKFVDATTEITALTTGEISMLLGVVEPEKVATARADANLTYNEYQRSGYGYIRFNCEAGATSDKAVRQALYRSFNIEEFVKSYFYDKASDTLIATTQYHPFSQVSWVIDDKLLSELPDFSFNMEEAKKMLDNAGWVVGPSGFREKNGQILELKIAAIPDHDILQTLIPMWQRDWGQSLKCKLSIAYLEFNTLSDYVIYNSDANVNNWSMYFMATSIASPDPDALYTTYHSSMIGSGKDNTMRYKNPTVDKMLDKGKSIMDINEAKAYYRDLVKIITEDAAMIPVYTNTYFDLYSKKVTDFKTNSFYPWTSALQDTKIVK